MNLARLKRLDKKYWFFIGVLLVAASLFFVWMGLSQTPKQTAYQTTPVTRGKLTASVGATGTVRAAQSARLLWQTSGRVEKVAIRVGDSVQTDQILASLAQDSLPARVVLSEADLVKAQQNLDNLQQSNITVAQAMQKLADAKQAVKDAQDKFDFYTGTTVFGRVQGQVVEDVADQMKQVKAQLKFLNWIYNRRYKNTGDDLRRKAEFNLNLLSSQQNLNNLTAKYNWYTGSLSETLLGQVRASLNLAKAQQEDAQRELDRLNDGQNVDDLNAARAKVAAAQATYNLSRIMAPFSGTVTQAQPQAGDRVSPGDLAFQVDDLSQLMVDLQVSEVDINSVAVGQPVTVTFDAVQGKTYTGLVAKVNLSGTQNQGAVDFTVTIALTEVDELVKPGMTAAVTITVKETDQALLIPNRAVRVVNSQRVVYVLKDGQPVAVVVRLGATADANSEVVGGDLKEGDLVILNPPAGTGPTLPAAVNGN
jgi:HlyD family secretion protein